MKEMGKSSGKAYNNKNFDSNAPSGGIGKESKFMKSEKSEKREFN